MSSAAGLNTKEEGNPYQETRTKVQEHDITSNSLGGKLKTLILIPGCGPSHTPIQAIHQWEFPIDEYTSH
jgi:hypothetical protein